MSAELARRAVACKYEPHACFLPDLPDPATQGCILTLIAHHMRTGMGFAEALVVTLEAAS